MKGSVFEAYWRELQTELSEVGLNVVVDFPEEKGYPWTGQIDGKPFTMTIPPKSEDGSRIFMIVSLFGQDEKRVVPLFSKFAGGYEPCCKYKHRRKPEAVIYEWDKGRPARRFHQLEIDPDVYNLQSLT